MSYPKNERGSVSTLWLNLAAIVGLLLFITTGFVILRHFSDPEPAPAPHTVDTDPSANNPLEPPRLVRPGEQPERFIFADPDVADAEEFRHLAQRAPKSAATVLSRMPDDATRDERLYDLMQIWVQIDPAQAADWVNGLPFSGLKNDATTELGLAWGDIDPEATAGWVEENIFTENAPAGAASLSSAWARNDIEAASDWVGSLDVDAPARKFAMQALAFQLGELDPVRGLTWISRLKLEDRNLILVNFAASWSASDPLAAANWLRYQAGGTDKKVREQATLAVIHGWTANESEAASAADWIYALEDGKLKENAKATFAESHSETSPLEALPWAQDINDPERRLDVTMVVLEELVLQDIDSFKTEITNRWEAFAPPLREQVYDLLLDHDPDFKKELIRLFEEKSAEEE